MKKKFAPVVISLGLIGLAGCAQDDNGNGNTENDESETEFGNVLSTSDAGDVTTDDILNQIGTTTVANQTFQMTLDNILQDKYSDEVDAEEIESQIDSEIENMGGEEQFEMMLAQQQPGMTVDLYKEQRITNAYHDQFFEEKFEVTDEEAKESVREASHILVSTEQENGQGQDEEAEEEVLSDEEAREKAESLKQEVDDGADFAELAAEESDDPGSAENNGELGFVSEGQMVEEFENALFELEPGEVSEPVQTQFGYHIIQRHDEENIDEELPAIKQQVVSQRIQENQDQVLDFYREVLEEYNAEFENDDIRTFIEDTYLNPESQEAPQEAATPEEPAEGDAPVEGEAEEESSEEETTEEAAE